MDFVYVYKNAPAQGDELRWSIRSIKRHFCDSPRVVVVGDPPSWYAGPCVPVRSIHGAYRDTANKLFQAFKSPRVSDRFVWMMDDIYFLRAFSTDEIATPRASSNFANRRMNRWRPPKSLAKTEKAHRANLVG